MKISSKHAPLAAIFGLSMVSFSLSACSEPVEAPVQDEAAQDEILQEESVPEASMEDGVVEGGMADEAMPGDSPAEPSGDDPLGDMSSDAADDAETATEGALKEE